MAASSGSLTHVIVLTFIPYWVGRMRCFATLRCCGFAVSSSLPSSWPHAIKAAHPRSSLRHRPRASAADHPAGHRGLCRRRGRREWASAWPVQGAV